MREFPRMAHVVCEPCRDCRYTDCVAVCPVDCFHEAERLLYIDPAVCIDCAVCIPECPVEAIYADFDVPEEWTSFIELNVLEAMKHPIITETKEPLPGAPHRE